VSLFAVQFAEQLEQTTSDEFQQFVGALNAAFAARDRGTPIGLLLGLEFGEQLDPIVRNEFEQLAAAVQVAFNQHRFVKSRQEIVITMTAGQLTATGTLALPVAVANTELRLLGCRGGSLGRVSLTSTSVVTATREEATGAATCTCIAQAIEYYPDVLAQAVQYGTMVVSATTTASAGITPVGTGASLQWLGFSTPADSTGADWGKQNFTLSLSASGALVSVQNAGTATSGTYGFCVVDFKV
jgi:hypothetical protein